MIKRTLCACLAGATLFSCKGTTDTTDVIDYINPIIGASTSAEAGKSGHGLGKTFPGSATPFGLVQLSPDTKTGGDNGPGYSWHHKTIEGFSFIHMSGIGWYGEFGNFLVIPNIGPLRTGAGDEKNPETGYRSRYSHDTETAKAGYYAVDLDDYGIRTELTSAPHAGIIRMTYPKSDSARISIDLARRIGGSATEQYIKVIDDHTIEGWMRCTSVDGGWGNGDGNVNYTVYFYSQLSKPLENVGVWSADVEEFARRNLQTIHSDEWKETVSNAEVFHGCKEKQGKHIGFFSEFATEANEEVLLKAGISFVSIEGAKANLQAEIPDWDFDRVRKENNDLWRNAFQNIRVKGGTEEEKIIFYTALYHTMIDPRSTSDVTGQYIGGDGKVHQSDQFVYRTIFSGWDVFRSQFPLQTIINPRMVNDEVNSLLSLAELSGKEYLERWEIMNSYSGCMIGNPAVSVILDAYQKNIREWDKQKAYQYCLNSVQKFGNGELTGYVPNSISLTLEYAYSEWCMGEFANLLGKKDVADTYFNKSLNYKNIWDDSIQWFRGKRRDGTFGPWPGETTQDLYCVESNPLQQGWFVPHDVYGFMDLLGHKKFTEKLTAFFDNSPEDFLWNDYYNHPNEPVHQVPFMFAYTGNSWLTQKWTRKICANAYGTDVMGLCGNEDVGQMSAWYILAAMGMHPVNPGDNIYILTSPVFKEIAIQLDPDFYKGKSFTIKARNNSPENVYIQSAKLNGKELDRGWIRHEELAEGGTLEFVMGPEPNYAFGADNLPPSFGRNRWSVE